MKIKRSKVSYFLILIVVATCINSCGGGSSTSSSGSTNSSNTISGQVLGPSGSMASNWLRYIIDYAFASNQQSGIPNATITVYQVNNKGKIAGDAIATTTADDSGNYELSIPSDILLSQLETIIIAEDPNNPNIAYSSFINGNTVDIDLESSSSALAVKTALMAEAQALLSELSAEEWSQLTNAANAVFNIANPSSFSAAYNALRSNAQFRDKLDEVTTTDLSGVDYSKIPPLMFPPLILNSDLEETEAAFKVGDEFRIEARALDFLSSALEYKFKIKRDCVDSEVLQDWSADDTLDYTFQVSDVTNCTEIVIQVRNSDGTFLDGVDGDLEYSVSFTSQPTWTAIANDAYTPTSRSSFTSIWSGSKMIVWGGSAGGTVVNDGAAYNLAANSWTSLSNTNAPSERSNHTAVWTGSNMIVWGGEYGQILRNDGATYNPSTDTWTPIAIDGNTPNGRMTHTAVWTGSKMIIWGGYNAVNTCTNTGSIYDPNTDSWTQITTTNAPLARCMHSAIWTGSKMIVWGGYNPDADPINNPNVDHNDGGIYDPATDTWTLISTTDAPTGRLAHMAAWTGTKMIVWGGMTSNAQTQFNSGGIYDPIADTWTATTLTNAPVGRSYGPTASWLGDSIFIWGGFTDSGSTTTNTGGIYSSKTLNWKATTLTNAPTARAYAQAVWTGSKVIVWGGSLYNDGKIYAP